MAYYLGIDVGTSGTKALIMDARAHSLLPRLMNPLIKGMIQKAIEKDMDTVKAYCEARET